MKTLLFNRNRLRIALGSLWLLDGLLQLQPRMFTKQFADNVIRSAATGQPTPLHSLIVFGSRTILHAPVLFGLLIALVQILIGILILRRKTAKQGLALSIAWGLSVWLAGEGLGGVLVAGNSLMAGAPGAALLYVVLSFAAWPKAKETMNGPAPSWLEYAWASIWIGCTILLLTHPDNMGSNPADVASMNAAGAPSWLAYVDNFFASILAGMGSYASALMTLMQAAIGVGVFYAGKTRRVAITSGIVLSLFYWVVGQSIGEMYSGLATDPGTAPLIILMGLALLSVRRERHHAYMPEEIAASETGAA